MEHVSAIIVTRGDVDNDNLVNALPPEWETLLWDNGAEVLSAWRTPDELDEIPVQDLSVYGRYAAIEYATGDLIYVQDDDCIVSDPAAIVQAWRDNETDSDWGRAHVVCNMPARFRDQPQYERGDQALVGFGACFHRDAPERAFRTLNERCELPGVCPPHWTGWALFNHYNFRRTCDIVFTALTPRVLVDVPYENLPWAEAEMRMYRQPQHVEERMRMLELVRKVRDGDEG